MSALQQPVPVVTRTSRDGDADRGAVSAPGWLAHVMETLRDRRPGVLIGNEWAHVEGRISPVIDPSTEQTIGHQLLADAGTVDLAVRAAEAAQPAWGALGVTERAACFARLAELIEQNAALIATVDAIDAGLPVLRMFVDVDGALNALRGWPGLASALRGEVLPSAERLHYTRYVPYGVVARIVAFNHPFLFAVKGCLAALIAGNTIVLKPADQTPMSALLLGDLVRKAFPAGVFNIVTGDAATGSALVTHPAVSRIAFTGSSEVGRRIQQDAAGDRVRAVSLELGGKNPMIVFPDADIEAAARGVVHAMNLRANQGQSCGSTSRLLVHEAVADTFARELTQQLAALTLGPAYDPDNDMGPLISAKQAERVRAHISGALADGAKLLTGGLDDPRIPAAGYFVAPTLFGEVPYTSRLRHEEVFGPVIALNTWHDEADMFAEANDTTYGLTASVWTRDVTKALASADRLNVGYVWVNDATKHYWGMPYGGFKNSGIGREESFSELLGYLQVKSVHVNLNVPQ